MGGNQQQTNYEDEDEDTMFSDYRSLDGWDTPKNLYPRTKSDAKAVYQKGREDPDYRIDFGKGIKLLDEKDSRVGGYVPNGWGDHWMRKLVNPNGVSPDADMLYLRRGMTDDELEYILNHEQAHSNYIMNHKNYKQWYNDIRKRKYPKNMSREEISAREYYEDPNEQYAEAGRLAQDVLDQNPDLLTMRTRVPEYAHAIDSYIDQLINQYDGSQRTFGSPYKRYIVNRDDFKRYMYNNLHRMINHKRKYGDLLSKAGDRKIDSVLEQWKYPV